MSYFICFWTKFSQILQSCNLRSYLFKPSFVVDLGRKVYNKIEKKKEKVLLKEDERTLCESNVS